MLNKTPLPWKCLVFTKSRPSCIDITKLHINIHTLSMTDAEKPKDGSDSIGSMNDFNPAANSTMVDDEHTSKKEPASSQPQTPDKEEKPEPEQDAEPPPSSVSFFDQTGRDNKHTIPIGPMPNSDKIVSETQGIIHNLFQLMLQQRRFLLVCAYQISSLQSIVQGHYDPHLSKIETFLTYSNGFQTEWFFQYYRLLPLYADYALVLQDRPDRVMVNEVPNSVQESALKSLAEDVITNMFAGGLQVKVQRSMNTEVSLKMDHRREEIQQEELPLKMWMELFEVQSENAKKVEEKCFELLSSVDLLVVDGNLKPKGKHVRFVENT